MPASDRLKGLIGLLVVKPNPDDPRVQKAQQGQEFCWKLMLLIGPIFGAITPIFAEKPADYVRYIGLASVLILAALAGKVLFGRLK
jgi:hypothetical protein